MDGVTIVSHPLVQHKLTLLRKKDISTKSFRELLKEIGMLLCYEITRDLPLADIDIEQIKEPLRIFDGTAREAAKGFPANLNVAVALSLAGIGPDRTRLEIWADPALTRNVHRVEVESDSARFSMSIENIPSENPKTGRITALSVIAFLRKQRAPLRVGT